MEKLKCPSCSSKFDKTDHLLAHRRSIHGWMPTRGAEDGKSEIERQIERMGFTIHVYIQDNMPVDVYVTKEGYQSSKARRW
jgi:uncharacterized C2H2 Zn-finger protein